MRIPAARGFHAPLRRAVRAKLAKSASAESPELAALPLRLRRATSFTEIPWESELLRAQNKKTAPERSSAAESGLGAGPKRVSGCVGPAIFHNYARNDVSD